MSRQYQSPLDRQPPNLFPSGQPPSFKTNVNRAKTKKWVEAKPMSYGGDDWGDFDEDDEYGVESQPPAPPKPTGPTGLRQKGYGMMGAGEPARSFTQPMHRTNSFEAGDERRTFSSGQYRPPQSAGVEGTHLGGAQPGQIPYSNYAPASGPLHVQTDFISAQSRASPAPEFHRETPSTGPSSGRQVSVGSWSQLGGSDVGSSVDPQQRRDFSPSAMPPPLHTRASPAPSVIESPAGARFPLRKSSLSQQVSPVAQAAASPSQSVHSETAPSQAAGSAPTSPNKPLPFIRPADIYKRMEEARRKEREERESLDLGRPNIDTTAPQPSNDSASQATSGPLEQIRDTVTHSNERKPSLDPVRETSEPAPERRQSAIETNIQEQGLPGFSVSNPALAAALGASMIQPSTSPSDTAKDVPTYTRAESESTERSGAPSLPTVSRTSGFSDDFWSSSQLPAQAAAPAVGGSAPVRAAVASESVGEQKNSQPEPFLQHQPSFGFVSAVHDAFDRKDDSSVPPTPISKHGDSLSEPETIISRSNTSSTAGISPIMSRVPEGPAAPVNVGTTRVSGSRPTSNVAEGLSEAVDNRSRPTSIATLRDVQQVPMKPSPAHSRNESVETLPRPHTPGYRRDLNTPSPSNSPARSPAIETHPPVPEPSAAVFDDTSPVSAAMAHAVHPVERGRSSGDYARDFTAREADLANTVSKSPFKAAEAAGLSQSEFLDSRKDASVSSFAPASPVADLPVSRNESPTKSLRNESPTKGRVRDLAGKFNEIADSRRNSVQSIASKKSVSSWNQSKEDLSLRPASIDKSREPSPSPSPERAPPTSASPARSPTRLPQSEAARPAADRALSFRPKLPGQWESYITTAAPTPPIKSDEEPRLPQDEHKETDISRPDPVEDVGHATPKKTTDLADEDVDLAPTTQRRPAATDEATDEAPKLTEDPVAALKAAGAAIGESIMASVGLGQSHEAPEPPSASDDSEEEEEQPEDTKRKVSVGDVFIRPLAVDRAASSVASSVPPTPPPKDFPAADKSDHLSQTSPRASLEKTPTRDSYAAASTSIARPPMHPYLNTDSSIGDMESDRLREEIEKSLNLPSHPEAVTSELVVPGEHADTVTSRRSLGNRESGVLPSAYEEYWNTSNVEKEALPGNRSSAEPPTSPEYPVQTAQILSRIGLASEARPAAEPDMAEGDVTNEVIGSARPALSKRFSWENSDADLSQDITAVPRTTGDESPRVASPIERLINEDSKIQGFDGTKGAYAGTAETGPAQEQHSILANPEAAEHDMIKHLPAPPQTVVGPPESPRVSGTMDSPPRSRPASGLHVVNDVNPEPVELPARLSMEARPPPPPERSPTPPARSPSLKASPTSPSLKTLPTQPSAVETDNQLAPPHSPTSPTRIPPFREILALKAPEDRIKTYNTARSQFATMDTGLNTWLASTFAAHASDPEYAAIARIGTRPTVTTAGLTGSTRGHKHSPSISRFTKQSPIGGVGQQGVQPQTPYYQQYLDSAAQVPGGSAAGSPAVSMGPQSQGASPIGGGKITGKDVQAKGKDLLHTAGVLGGKATVGAKGLFAKGMGRFKGGNEKAPKTPSEDPSLPSRPGFSPFRRRSSRPSSIVLPKNEDFPLPTQSQTPSTVTSSLQLPPVEQADQWAQGFLEPTRGATPDRLGVLPSPGIVDADARRTLSAGGERDGREEASRPASTHTERLIQSVVRHATPPVADEVAGTAPSADTASAEAEPTRPGVTRSFLDDETPLSLQESKEKGIPEPEMGPAAPEQRVERAPGLTVETDISEAGPTGRAKLEEEERTPTLYIGQLGSGSASEVAATVQPLEGIQTKSEGPKAESHSRTSTPDSWEKEDTADNEAFEHVHGSDTAKEVAPTEQAHGQYPPEEPSRPQSTGPTAVSETPVRSAQVGDDADRKGLTEPLEPAMLHGRRSEEHKVDNVPTTGGETYEGDPMCPNESSDISQQHHEAQKAARPLSFIPNGQGVPESLQHGDDNQNQHRPAEVQPYNEQYGTPASHQRSSSQPSTQVSAQDQYPIGQHAAQGPSSLYDERAQYPPAPTQYAGYSINVPRNHQRSASQPLDSMESGDYPAQEQLTGQRGPYWENQRPPVPQRNSSYGFDQFSYPENDGVQHIGNQVFTRQAMDPRQYSIEYHLPGVGPPPPSDTPEPKLRKTSVLFNGRGNRRSPAQDPTASRERINPQLTAPAPYRGFSYQSSVGTVDSSNTEQQQRRRSGFFSFKRSGSIGADARLSGQNTPKAGNSQADLISQSSANPALVAASRAAETSNMQPTDARAPRKLQRASSSSTPDLEKKKSRFSVLGTIFGRSNSTMNAQKPNKLTKANSKGHRELAQSAGTPSLSRNPSAYEAMPQQSYRSPPPPNRRQSSGRWQESESELTGPRPPMGSQQEPGVPPPGGFYAPAGRTYAGGASPEYAALQQQASGGQPMPPSSYIDSRSPPRPSYTDNRMQSNGSRYYTPPPAQQSPPPRHPSQGSIPSPTGLRRTSSPLNPNQQQRRMPSIDAAAYHQQQQPSEHQERPWTLSLPPEQPAASASTMRYDPSAPGGWRPGPGVRNAPQQGRLLVQTQGQGQAYPVPVYQNGYGYAGARGGGQDMSPPPVPGKVPLQPRRHEREPSDEPVMRGASYPGMEWQPRWDGE